MKASDIAAGEGHGWSERRGILRRLGPRLVVMGAVWVVVLGVGHGLLWNYATAPGVAAVAPQRWPVESRIVPAGDRATLFMVVHPQCPCTRASISQLARLMARIGEMVAAYVLFVGPKGAPAEWYQTDLQSSVGAIPGVTVLEDDEGREAERFRASTSGQVLLYDRDGVLLFSGGITTGRGHAGDKCG